MMSASRSKMLTITGVLFAVGALLGEVDGCSCFPGSDLCDFIENAAVMIHATALSRSDQADINADVTYTVDIITVYKSEPDASYEQVLSFTTGGNSALCGIYLEIGEEYLLDLFESGRGLEAVGACGATQLWSSVTEEDLGILQDGGCPVLEGDSSCENSACGEFQECVPYAPTDGSINPYPEGYYCADVCDPSPCDASETCRLVPTNCVTVIGAVCPPVAECSQSTIDPCDVCGEFQECLLYAEGTADEEYYCADVCDPSPCADDEVCSLFPVACFRAPCPSVSDCSPSTTDPSTTKPSTTDPCKACHDFQICGVYEGNGKWYCSDTCSGEACSEGEQCELQTRAWCLDGGAGCPLKRTCF